jgi:hypothetical protein
MIARIIGVALGVLLIHAPAFAGSAAGGVPQFKAEQLVALSKKLEREVAARRARVAIVARVGRSPVDLPDGIEFTHVAFVVYSKITLEDGRTVPGYAMYNLYQSDERPNSSFLRQDYPLDYYAAVHRLKAGIIIPKPELQQRLLKVIFSDTYQGLHNPRYSAVSNPFNRQYQNCTEFVLDVINAAIYETSDHRQIKTNIEAYFQPQPVAVSPFKLFLGSIFVPDITISDHPGPVATATFWSIARYMQGHGIADEVLTVSVD